MNKQCDTNSYSGYAAFFDFKMNKILYAPFSEYSVKLETLYLNDYIAAFQLFNIYNLKYLRHFAIICL